MTEAKSTQPTHEEFTKHLSETATEVAGWPEVLREGTRSSMGMKSTQSQLPPRAKLSDAQLPPVDVAAIDRLAKLDKITLASRLLRAEAENESLKAELTKQQIAACECSHDEACALFLLAEKAEAERDKMREALSNIRRPIGASFPADVIAKACKSFDIPETEDTMQAITDLFSTIYMAGFDGCQAKYNALLSRETKET